MIKYEYILSYILLFTLFLVFAKAFWIFVWET